MFGIRGGHVHVGGTRRAVAMCGTVCAEDGLGPTGALVGGSPEVMGVAGGDGMGMVCDMGDVVLGVCLGDWFGVGGESVWVGLYI